LDSAAPPSTPKQALLAFLLSISGKKTLSGVHNREPNSDPAHWTTVAYNTTGKYPALWGGDFLFEQDNIDARPTMIAEAKNEWSAGAVVDLMYHACPPTQGEACDWDSGVKSHLSDSEWSELITDGAGLNGVWKSRLDQIAVYLQDLKDSGVAVLFRPQHEMNQGVFWWGGRTGPNGTSKLYQITHDYLTRDKGLDNIVWVWSVQDLSWDFDQYNPGSDYFDIASLDVYGGDGFTQEKYNAMLAVSGGKPIAIGECARLPTASELAASPQWIYFMGWAELTFSSNSAEELTSLFSAPNVLVRDQMPGWTR
jgi:mannan endo-1,4-beta-mannosidase